MRLLTRYLLRQTAGVVILCLLLGAGLVYLLQLLRLGHHLAGALSAGLLARAFVLSLPTLLLGCLPLALAAALLFSLGRLSDRGELEAFAAAGASPLQIARPLLLLALCSAALAGALARVEPGAVALLSRLATGSAARALWLGAAPGRFHELAGATLHFEARRPGPGGELLLERLLLALDDRILVVARAARIRIDESGRARVDLEAGELQSLPVAGSAGSGARPSTSLRRVQFESASLALDLRGELRAHLGFLGGLVGGGGWIARGVSAASSCLCLSILALAIGLRVPRRGLRRAGLGLAVTAGYAFASWGASVLGGLPGGLCLDGVLLTGGMVLLGGRERLATC
jgi:hypothetical protein